MIRKRKKKNLALKGTAAASEAEADSTSAAKAIDGNKGTHWSTSQNKVTNEWIEVTLEKPTSKRNQGVLGENGSSRKSSE